MTPGDNNDDDDDRDVLKAWREGVRDMPDAALDGRVLAAAHSVQARRRVLPLVLAMAACLIVAVYESLLQPVPQAPAPHAINVTMIGLNDGRSNEIMRDQETTQQMMIRQMPGGSN